MDDLPRGEVEDDEQVVGAHFGGSKRIIDRESDYSKRRLNRTLSPTRHDAFAAPQGGNDAGAANDAGTSTYADRMKEAALDRERDNTMRQIAQKKREEAERAAADARRLAAAGGGAIDAADAAAPVAAAAALAEPEPAAKRRRNRWDSAAADDSATPKAEFAASAAELEWEDGGGADAAARQGGDWGATPVHPTAVAQPTPKRNRSRWDETPLLKRQARSLPSHAGPRTTASARGERRSLKDFLSRRVFLSAHHPSLVQSRRTHLDAFQLRF